MKTFLGLGFFVLLTPALANTWKYQVNINGNKGAIKNISSSKATFDAGPYFCEVSPVNDLNNTEYRSLICAIGSGVVSTGGLCTQKGAKFPSVQYAILNLSGPKNLINVVVSCEFD